MQEKMRLPEIRRSLWRPIAACLGSVAFALTTGAALASEPTPWQLGMQQPASVVKQQIHDFHDFLLVLITVIALFVLGLLAYTMVRFRRSRNPTPSKTAHNTTVEIVWTAIPVVILVIVAVPSFKLLYFADRIETAEMTLKVYGHQWYWAYEYPDHGGFKFDSVMVADKDLKPGQKRLLDVDNPVVVPANTNIRVLFAGVDVMHSWYVPALGVQLYTIPGRLHETWMNVSREGVYYGQCNQICGVNHGFMPIKVQALPKAEFAKWADETKKRLASAPTARPVVVAATAP
jgi:cytochrome c oxidase subunit 2